MALGGCGPRYAWEGRWEGARDAVIPPGMDPTAAYSLSRVRLEVKERGRFVATDGGIPLRGSIRASGMSATLYVEFVLDRDIRLDPGDRERWGRPIKLKALGEQEVEWDNPAAIVPGIVKLRRK